MSEYVTLPEDEYIVVEVTLTAVVVAAAVLDV